MNNIEQKFILFNIILLKDEDDFVSICLVQKTLCRFFFQWYEKYLLIHRPRVICNILLSTCKQINLVNYNHSKTVPKKSTNRNTPKKFNEYT